MKHIIPINEYTNLEDYEPPTEPGMSQGDARLGRLQAKFNRLYSKRNWEEIITVLENECGEFLTSLKQNKEVIFRGVSEDPGYGKVYGMLEKTPRTDRNPMDMNKEISDEIDDWFLHKFGERLRSNGVFATKDYPTSKKYGKEQQSSIVFPVDGYKCFWNPDIIDLWVELRDSAWYRSFVLGKRHLDGEFERRNGIESIVNGYTEGRLEEVKKQEITFICKKYFVIDDAFLPILLDYLG